MCNEEGDLSESTSYGKLLCICTYCVRLSTICVQVEIITMITQVQFNHGNVFTIIFKATRTAVQVSQDLQ